MGREESWSRTGDDGDLALERPLELGWVDIGVDVGAEARGELGRGGLILFLGHLFGLSSPVSCSLMKPRKSPVQLVKYFR